MIKRKTRVRNDGGEARSLGMTKGESTSRGRARRGGSGSTAGSSFSVLSTKRGTGLTDGRERQIPPAVGSSEAAGRLTTGRTCSSAASMHYSLFTELATTRSTLLRSVSKNSPQPVSGHAGLTLEPMEPRNGRGTPHDPASAARTHPQIRLPMTYSTVPLRGLAR